MNRDDYDEISRNSFRQMPSLDWTSASSKITKLPNTLNI